MNHIPYEKWRHYVKDELEEKVREQYDEHLYGCDQCLTLYSEAVEAVDQQFPMMTKNATDEVMRKIVEQKMVDQPTIMKKASFYQKAVFHYILAAAMTVLLMSSGIFSQLVNVVSDFESLDKSESSTVSGLMNKSISIIDSVENKTKEGE